MQKENIQKIPRHVAIIMDGNGRWAEKRGLKRVYGHVEGVESVRKIIRSSLKRGVEYLTLYAFSTENWGRPSEEVTALMELFCEHTAKSTPEMMESGVRIRFIGNLGQLSQRVRDSIRESEQATAQNKKFTLLIALNYSSRWELTQATRTLAEKAVRGECQPEEITEEMLSQHLTTAGIPDPDLLIRTSGEQRLSNFLLWQLSYSEFYFTEAFWPDFDDAQYDQAIEEYSRRCRRYGLVTEQLPTKDK